MSSKKFAMNKINKELNHKYGCEQSLMRKIEFWIVTSSEDRASMNIRKHLLDKFPFIPCIDPHDEWKKWEENSTHLLNLTLLEDIKIQNLSNFKKYFNIRLVLTEKRMIFLDDSLKKKKIGGDFIIFASRHRSKSGLPAILTHTTGNWDSDTSYGGNSNSLSKTSAFMLGFAYKNLLKQKELKNLEWAVDLEVDHHGPTEIKAPLIFMELGSTPQDWEDNDGVAAVGDAILGTIFNYLNFILNKLHIDLLLEEEKRIKREDIYGYIYKILNSMDYIIGIGFGGPHYARNFSKIYKNNDAVYISHIVPKYHISKLTKNHIDQMLTNTIEPINAAILDWKGLNAAGKNHIKELLNNYSIKIYKSKDLR
ncbi:MAG: D-aminoacyl-tRNA deacylase [Promethearchaeota archaeon]